MIDKISALSGLVGPRGLAGLDSSGPLAPGKKTGQGSFADIIKEVLDTASASAEKAKDLNTRLQMDDPSVSLEQSVIASNVSSLQFTAVVQTRNKIVQAYTDIMNMPI
ncbi:MAG: flagellar hook-basal body complex protein FliE [Limnobacter sp.]|nr:flagellar hook-basal body complex protein FliE [Limnobacter sp.]